MTKTLDVICIGRSSVDLYGQQVGGRLEEMASFAKYVGGCPTNISIGTARLGLKPGLITGVGDEHMGRFIKEQAAVEGVDISNVKTDPARLTSLVILGIRDQETFPLDLLPRELRRCRAHRGRHRRGLHRIRQSGSGVGHAFLQAEPRCHEQEGDAPGEKTRRQGRLRYRLPAGAVGAYRPWPGRGALRREPRGERPPADNRAGLRRRRRHRGGDPYRRRLDRHARGMPPDPGAGTGGADRGQARADGLHRVRWKSPGRHRAGHQGAGLSGRGVQRAGRGRCLHERLPARLSARRADRDLLQVRQCLRRVCRLAPRLRAGRAELDRAAVFLRARLARARAAQGCRARADPLVDQPHARMAPGPGHGLRPPRPARGDGGCRRHQPRAHLLLQAAVPEGRPPGRRRAHGFRHPAGSQAGPGGPRRRERRSASGSAGRSSSRARCLCVSRAAPTSAARSPSGRSRTA